MPRTVTERAPVPTHPDRAPGLGFLSLTMMPFVPHLAAAGGGILSEDSLMPHRATLGGSIDLKSAQ